MSEFTPVTDYGEILEAIARAVRTTDLFKPAAMIEAAPGMITEAWLKKNSLPHGGALPAIAGLRGLKKYANGIHRHELDLGLYFIPEPGNRKRQSRDIANDVSKVVSLVNLNRWKIEGTREPENIRASNRFSPSLDAKGSTLWTIEWRQTFLLVDQLEDVRKLGLLSHDKEAGNAS